MKQAKQYGARRYEVEPEILTAEDWARSDWDELLAVGDRVDVLETPPWRGKVVALRGDRVMVRSTHGGIITITGDVALTNVRRVPPQWRSK